MDKVNKTKKLEVSKKPIQDKYVVMYINSREIGLYNSY